MPPNDGRLRRWVKLLLNLPAADGLGEPATGLSGLGGGPPRKEAGIPAVNEERFLACVRALGPALRTDEGDGGTSLSSIRGFGDPVNDPCLKGEF